MAQDAKSQTESNKTQSSSSSIILTICSCICSIIYCILPLWFFYYLGTKNALSKCNI